MWTKARVEGLLRNIRIINALYGAVFLLILVFLLVNALLFTMFTVDGHSMDTTLHDGEHMVVNIALYRFTEPKIGDVVVIAYAGDSRIRFVKRIEGVPGDSVAINGHLTVLGDGEYYVLGDNRDHSTDSRVYGSIQRSQILGKVALPILLPQYIP